jgi:hypothetical protein
MVTIVVPLAAVLAALSVSVLVVEVVMPVGLNEAVTPAGRPLTPRVTYPAKLLVPTTEIVLVPFVPATTLRLLVEADRE